MKKTISFGKIDLNGKGRKINEVTVEMNLNYDKDNKPCFSASADVWNSRHTDVEMCGQCLDDLVPFFKDNELYMEIVGLWQRNHLNDLTPGTPEQMRCLAEHKDEINEDDGWYTKELNLLKKYNLDVVDLDGKPYKYGTDWLTRDISKEDLKAIERIMK